MRRISRAHYLKHKEEARAFVLERLAHYSRIYGVSFNRVSIRNQRTRWGSCSKKGNLNFNYHVLMLPRHLADYIIIHEVCHLKELNHSARFWNLVAQVLPDYSKIRRELRSYRLN